MRATPAQWVIRRARRVPGYTTVRSKVLTRVRESNTARDVVTRMFAGAAGKGRGVPTRFPTAGNLLAGVGIDQLPVALVSLVGCDPAKIDEAIDDVARLQLLHASFRPVIVLDHPRFDATRRYEFATELVIAREAWDPQQGVWRDYLATRIADIMHHYSITVAVEVIEGHIPFMQRILLESLGQD